MDKLSNPKQGADKWQDHKCNVEDVRLEAKSDSESQFKRQHTKKEKRREWERFIRLKINFKLNVESEFKEFKRYNFVGEFGSVSN